MVEETAKLLVESCLVNKEDEAVFETSWRPIKRKVIIEQSWSIRNLVPIGDTEEGKSYFT